MVARKLTKTHSIGLLVCAVLIANSLTACDSQSQSVDERVPLSSAPNLSKRMVSINDVDRALKEAASQLERQGVVGTWKIKYPAQAELDEVLCKYDSQELVGPLSLPDAKDTSSIVLNTLNAFFEKIKAIPYMDFDKEETSEWELEAHSENYGVLTIEADHGVLEIEFDGVFVDANKCHL